MLPELNRYGEVYTTRIQQKNFSGKGVFDPEYVKTKADPNGKIIVDGVRSTIVIGDTGPDPAYVVETANTFRFKFSDPAYDPTVAGVGTTGTWTKREDFSYDGNIWDWTKSGTSFNSAFYNAFKDSGNLVSLIAAGDTSAVTNMVGLFQECTSLTSICLFDTSNVDNMSSMLRNCSSLASLPLFDTSSATTMSYMFRGCTLTTVPLLDTSKVTNINSMFLECTSLTSVPLFNLSAVTSMNAAFRHCASLTTLPLFNTSNVTNMGSAFRECTSLKSIPLFNTSKVTTFSYTFSDCPNVESGALAMYQQVSTQAAPPSAHYNTFTNCGKNTETGAAELAQIPASWGGLGAG